MPDGGGVRRRAAALGDGEGAQGRAAPGAELTVLQRLGLRRRPAVVYVTRRGCPQCEADLPVVRRLAARAGATLAVRDVDDDPDDRAAYGDHVPVVLVDGVQRSTWAVDRRALRRVLSAASRR